MRKNRIKLYFLCNNKIFFLNEANSVTQVTSVSAKCSFKIGIRYHIRHKTWTHNFKIVFFCYPETEEFRYSRKGRKAYEFLGCQIAIVVQLLNSNQAVFANFHQPPRFFPWKLEETELISKEKPLATRLRQRDGCDETCSFSARSSVAFF